MSTMATASYTSPPAPPGKKKVKKATSSGEVAMCLPSFDPETGLFDDEEYVDESEEEEDVHNEQTGENKDVINGEADLPTETLAKGQNSPQSETHGDAEGYNKGAADPWSNPFEALADLDAEENGMKSAPTETEFQVDSATEVSEPKSVKTSIDRGSTEPVELESPKNIRSLVQNSSPCPPEDASYRSFATNRVIGGEVKTAHSINASLISSRNSSAVSPFTIKSRLAQINGVRPVSAAVSSSHPSQRSFSIAGPPLQTQGLSAHSRQASLETADINQNPIAELDPNPFSDHARIEAHDPWSGYSWSSTGTQAQLNGVAESSAFISNVEEKGNNRSAVPSQGSRPPSYSHRSPLPDNRNYQPINGRLVTSAHPNRPHLTLKIVRKEDLPPHPLVSGIYEGFWDPMETDRWLFEGEEPMSWVDPKRWPRNPVDIYGSDRSRWPPSIRHLASPTPSSPDRFPRVKKVSFAESAPCADPDLPYKEPENPRRKGSYGTFYLRSPYDPESSPFHPPPTPHPRHRRGYRLSVWLQAIALLLASTALLLGVFTAATWEHAARPEFDLAPLHRAHFALSASLPASHARRSIAGRLDGAAEAFVDGRPVRVAAKDLRGFDNELATIAQRVAKMGSYVVADASPPRWYQRDNRATIMEGLMHVVASEVKEIQDLGGEVLESLARAETVTVPKSKWDKWMRAMVGQPVKDVKKDVTDMAGEAKGEVNTVLERFEPDEFPQQSEPPMDEFFYRRWRNDFKWLAESARRQRQIAKDEERQALLA